MSDLKEASEKELESMREDAIQTRKEQQQRHRALGALLNFYLWLPTPLKFVVLLFGLVYSPPMVQNLLNCINAPKRGRLRVISGPDYIFFYMVGIWGLIFCGIVSLLPDGDGGGTFTRDLQVVLTWLYLSLMLFTFITIGLDFKGGSWVGVAIVLFGLIAVLGWIGAQNEIPFIEMIWPAFAWFGLAEFPTNFVFALSCASLLIFTFVWIRMNLVKVLKIQGNYVQVWTLAAKSPKDTRASFSLVPDYDDINEAILGFSCRLNLKSKSSRIQSHEFANMPGGPVVEHIATHLLNAQEVAFATDDDLYHSDEGGEDDD